jgi:hypothetical protein
MFRDLPPGRYDLKPLPVGYTISPGGSTIVLTTVNSRNNDYTIGLTTPSITKYDPASALVNSGQSTAGVQLTIQGNDFTQPTFFTGNIFTANINKFTTGSVVLFAASQVSTTVINPTLLTASVDPSLLVTTGTVQVRVRNLGPSGDFIDSNPVSFIVGNSAPTLISVTGQPAPIIVGTLTSPFTITVNGSGFTPATLVRVNFQSRPTTYVNQNQVIGTVLPSDLTLAGFVPITVQNPNSVDSTPFQLPVLYPIPVLTQISPSSLTAQVALNAQPVQITVNGSNFGQSPTNLLDTATVLVNGTPVATLYVSANQLTAVIPASFVATPGLLQISVTNPLPNLAPSNSSGLFVVNPTPVITFLDAGKLTWNPNSPPNTFFNQPVVISGTDFSPNAVAWVNLPCDTVGLRKAISTVRNSSTQIIATIPIRCAGTYSLAVENPQPVGGLSNIAPLVVPSQSAATSAATSDVAPTFLINPFSNLVPSNAAEVSQPCDKTLSTVGDSSTEAISTKRIRCDGTASPEGGASTQVPLVRSRD